MSITILDPRPWVAGNDLTASNGDVYLATGPNMAKPYCDTIVVEGPKGPDGDQGGQGAPGQNGLDGEDGFSPSASCSVVDNRLNIQITNAAGTTSKDLDVCPNAG